MVQTAAKLVLEPIFEADFEDSAYGYRPGRSGPDAIKDVHRHICRGYSDVVDADLSALLRLCILLPSSRTQFCADRDLIQLASPQPP